jgi:Reverse transcriptase (RNA-dependent DNA polymerase)
MKTSGSAIAILILYVDDILLMENNISLLQSAKSSLKKVFSMKDLGETVYILGIKIYRDRSKRLIGLSQSTYIYKVLNRFSMQNSKKRFLPMNHGAQLSKTQCPLTTDEQSIMSRVPYASAIGSILYVMLCTRPDVSYAWSVTSRYQANPY